MHDRIPTLHGPEELLIFLVPNGANPVWRHRPHYDWLMAELRIGVNEVEHSDLVVGMTYEGGSSLGDEPIHKLLGTANMGGIRRRSGQERTTLIALFTTEDQSEWPDRIDRASGTLTYFGDNREPGQDLLAHGGNRLLRDVFQVDFSTRDSRASTPVFFIFSSADIETPRSVIFHGIAVPGDGGPEADWCVARWHPKDGKKFENYTIRLTLLAERRVRRAWIESVIAGESLVDCCPESFRHWVETGVTTPLIQPAK